MDTKTHWPTSLELRGFQQPPPPERPLWQMDLRHKLKLEPGRTDAVAMLIWQALYSSGSSTEAAEILEFDVEELRRAIRIIREEE